VSVGLERAAGPEPEGVADAFEGGTGAEEEGGDAVTGG